MKKVPSWLPTAQITSCVSESDLRTSGDSRARMRARQPLNMNKVWVLMTISGHAIAARSTKPTRSEMTTCKAPPKSRPLWKRAGLLVCVGKSE